MPIVLMASAEAVLSAWQERMAHLAAVVQSLDESVPMAPAPPSAPMAPPGAGPLPLPQQDLSGVTLVSEASTHVPAPSGAPRTSLAPVAPLVRDAREFRDSEPSRRHLVEACEEQGSPYFLA